MIVPSELRSRLYQAIVGIPELVTELGGDSQLIQEYKEQENGDLYSTVNEMKHGIIIACQGFRPSGEQMRLWAVDFSMFLKPRSGGDIFNLAAVLLGGVSQASGFDLGLPLRSLPIHPKFDEMQTPALHRRSIAVDEGTNFDFWELVTSFLSRGAE